MSGLQIKTGTVKWPAGKEWDNPYQPGEKQQNIVCTMQDGTEEKLYFRTGRQPHASLQKGAAIQIVYEVGQDGKRKRRLVADTGGGNMAPVAGDVPVKPVYQAPRAMDFAPAKPKMSATAFINERIKIMKEVMLIVEKNMEGMSEESIRTIATSILIEGSRKQVDFSELLVTQDEIVPTTDSNDDVEF